MGSEPSLPPLLRSPEFMLGAQQASEWPPDHGAEVAFAGRSNVGKSSAINAITQRKKLARTSKTPGRTQLINFFRLDDERRLVDLPGYGFAQVPLDMRRRWERFIVEYLTGRVSLRGLVMLMDIRHPLTELDAQLLDWTAGNGLAVHVLLTKADKLKRGKAAASLLSVRRALKDYPGECRVELFSAHSKLGVQQARERLVEWLN